MKGFINFSFLASYSLPVRETHKPKLKHMYDHEELSYKICHKQQKKMNYLLLIYK